MRNTNSIAIVGGGTAGLISALILKVRFPSKKIDLIASKEIGIIGVGEGSTEQWRQFMDFVGIDQYDLIEQTDASIKLGILFNNWSEEPFLQSIQYPFNFKNGQFCSTYAKLIGEGKSSYDITTKFFWEHMVPLESDNDTSKYISNQFHFNTHKLNEYLSKLALSKGIKLIDDIISDVNLDEKGYIDTLSGKKETYQYDFYIDSTGFKRILINKLGAVWESHSKYLKMNSAIVFPLPGEDSLPVWTLSHAMDYGWMFRIPVKDRFGNGYIYDKNYINADQAKQEVEKYFGKEIQVAKQISFDPGALKEVWIKNCVAIGLSASFIEPLEASSISTSIQQSFILMHRLENYTQPVVDLYNKSCRDILLNIRDFIILHYLTKKQNTQFWKDASSLELPDSLKFKLDLWEHKLPINEDFNDLSPYILFKEYHFIMILHGLGLFNKTSIKKEYESISNNLKAQIENTLNSWNFYQASTPLITHKEFIRRIHQRQKIIRGEL